MIVDNTNGKLEEVKKAAKEMGPDAEKSLNDCLTRMGDYKLWGKLLTKCHIYDDFAPYSFRFVLDDEKDDQIMNGGIIYSGPGLPSNGGAPSFTVSLDDDAAGGKRHMWSVHT